MKKLVINRRGALEISFSWIFAIIVGIFILFLAIFAVTKIMKTEETISDVKVGKEIGALLNLLETGVESDKTKSFDVPAESRILNRCHEEGLFGDQGIMISQKSFNKWTEPEIESLFKNKYIFSNRIEEGKTFYLFSKPFEFPFKVSDLVYMSSSLTNYCFKGLKGSSGLKDIENDIEKLSQGNLHLEESEEKCPDNSINVCFNVASDCDIVVNYDGGYTKKDGETLYFVNDALMYATIFSNKDIYECQVKRLMKRAKSLAEIYSSKEVFTTRVGCGSNVGLNYLAGMFEGVKSSGELSNIPIDDVRMKNDGMECQLW